MATLFGSYDAQKCASWREFFDPPVTRVGDQNISVAINTQSGRGIKLSLVVSSAALEHVSIFGQRTELFGYLIERSRRQGTHASLKLLNVLVRDIQDVKRPYPSAKGERNRIFGPKRAE